MVKSTNDWKNKPINWTPQSMRQLINQLINYLSLDLRDKVSGSSK